MIEHVRRLDGGPVAAEGFLVIDEDVAGTSAGGLRMRSGLSSSELRLLAADMTLKYGFLGIPQGGAKGGIAWDAGAPEPERRSLLESYGRAFASFIKTRGFIPGPDMGTTENDVEAVFRAAGRPLSRVRFSGCGTGHYTGLSVFIAVRTALAFIGRPVAGATVALEGFGKVGSAAAAFLARAGAKVVAVSTKYGAVFDERGLPVEELISLAGRDPAFPRSYPAAGPLSMEGLKELLVDVICLCALVHSLDDDNWRKVRAKAIASGANSALTQAAVEGLHGAGTVVVPDFISNCGGVLGTYLEIAAFRPDEVRRHVASLLGPAVDEMLREAARRRLPPTAVARPTARMRFVDAKRRTEEKRGLAGVSAYRSARRLRPFLPRFILKAAGLAHFRRTLRGPLFGPESG